MIIRELVKHLEEQISHKDAREPNANWVLNELKKYLEEKDGSTVSDIDNMLFNEELKKIMKCQWCDIPIDSEQNLVVVIQDMGKFRVCAECLNDYANNEYDKLTAKIKQVKG